MIDSTVWHYTIGQNFIEIAESGFLKRASMGVTHPEKPILWFSSNQYWEPTANKCQLVDGEVVKLTMDETRSLGGGLMRFGISRDRLHQWDKLWKKAKIAPLVARALEDVGVDQGALPSHWFGLLKNIHLSETTSIQVMTDSGWVDAFIKATKK